MERGFYSDQIKQIQSTFNNDQLLLLQNEALRNDPNKVLGKVAKFHIDCFIRVSEINENLRWGQCYTMCLHLPPSTTNNINEYIYFQKDKLPRFLRNI